MGMVNTPVWSGRTERPSSVKTGLISVQFRYGTGKSPLIPCRNALKTYTERYICIDVLQM
jgi:hypothetical protein